MKKTLILLLTAALCTALLAGCGSGRVEKRTDVTADTPAAADQTEQAAETGTTPPETTMAAITNDKPVRIYLMDYSDNTAKLIETVTDEWDPDRELGTFGVFISDDDVISFDSEIAAHQEDWDSVNTEDKYKIGYEIIYEQDGVETEILILGPEDIEESGYLFMGDADSGDVTGYMGVWLYDDYHQDGGFYSHITQDEVNDDTLLTSIKLRPTPQSDEIDNLKLRVFSYVDGLELNEIKQYNTEYGYEVSFIKG